MKSSRCMINAGLRIERNKLGMRRRVVFSSFSFGKQFEEPNPTTSLLLSIIASHMSCNPIAGMLVAS